MRKPEKNPGPPPHNCSGCEMPRGVKSREKLNLVSKVDRLCKQGEIMYRILAGRFKKLDKISQNNLM